MTTNHLLPDEALAQLMTGNRRYINGVAEHPNQTAKRRLEVSAAPRPAAVVLGCADSRVPPEICFDQGIGDLFVVRTAGNILDEMVLGTIEFGVMVFNIPLVMVLGHTQCGAIIASVEGKPAPGHMSWIMSALAPVIEHSRDRTGDAVFNSTIANIHHVVNQVKNSQPLLAQMVEEGKIMVVGALYDIDSGIVELI